MRLLWLVLLLSSLPLPLFAVTVTDDMGREITLDTPPGKIVSLAPHLTEMLFSLGVGDRVVATVRHSDYPEAATRIPRLGDAFSLSIESIVALSPDLILAWTTGGNGRTLEQLRALGYNVYLNEAATLDDIATTVQRVGLLVGRKDRGVVLAEAFRADLMALSASQADAGPRVFFQISDAQLYTVNDDHLIGQALRTCKARNVFGELSIPVPLVSLESVVERDPQVIIVAAPYEGFTSEWQGTWTRLGWHDRVKAIDASLITRPSLRMLEGIKSLCKNVRGQRD